MRTKRSIFIGIVMLVFAGYLLFYIGSQSGTTGLKGGFKEITANRNENNTGPVIRLYAVEVKDTAGAAYIPYGNFMPHTKYGKTTVYFFLPGQSPAVLSLEDAPFDTLQYHPIATFYKNSMGNVMLKK